MTAFTSTRVQYGSALRVAAIALIVSLSALVNTSLANSGKVAVAQNLENVQIQVDGDLSDWPSDAPRHPITHISFGDAPTNDEDLSAWFSVGYDPQGARMFVAIEVLDDEWTVSNSPDEESWRTQDMAGIYLQTDHGLNGQAVDEARLLVVNAPVTSPHWEGCSKRVGNKVSYEWSFDLSAAMPKDANQPFTIAMSAEAIDRDSDSLTVCYWSPHAWKQQNASRSGDVILNVDSKELGEVAGRVSLVRKKQASSTGPTIVRFISKSFEQLVVETMTDESGLFCIDLPAGEYDVSVSDWNSPSGNSPVATQVKVTAQESVSCDLVYNPDVESRICTPTKQPFVGNPISEEHQNSLTDQAYHARIFTARNGLASGQKNDLLVTPDGAIWIATELGLLRVRGDEISKYDLSTGLRSQDVRCLYYDNHHVWLGTAEGIARLNPDTNEVVFPSELLGKSVARIRPLHDGRIGIATDRGLFAFDAKRDRFDCYGTQSGLLDPTCLSLRADRSNGFSWVGTEHGLVKCDGERATESFTTRNGLPDTRIWEITIDSRGHVWFGANRSIFVLKGSAFKTIRGGKRETYRHCSSIIEDQDQQVWCRTYLPTGETAVAIYARASKQALIHEAAENVSHLTSDRFDNVWLISSVHLKQIETTRRRLSGGTCNVVLADPENDRVWYSCLESGKYYLRCIRESRTRKIEFDAESPYEITSLGLNENDDLWVGTKSHGVVRFDGKGFSPTAYSSAMPRNRVRVERRTEVFNFCQHSNGRVYCATNAGILVLQDNSIVDHFSNLTTGLPVSHITWVDEYVDGQLACGTYSGVLFVDPKVGSETNRLGVEQGLTDGFVPLVKTCSDGTLWIGTYAGFYRYQNTLGAEEETAPEQSITKLTRFDEPKGILNTNAFDLIELDVDPVHRPSRSHLCVASAMGVALLDPRHGVSQTFLEARDIRAQERFLSVSAGRDSIWIGSTHGLTQCISSKVGPSLFCETNLDKSNGTCYATTDETTTIKFHAQSASTNHDQMVFRYRISQPNEHSNWQIATSDTISIPKLAAGDYHFDAIAFDRNLRASQPISFKYRVSLPWMAWGRRAMVWLTSLACLATGMLFIVNTVRAKRQLERRVEARTAEALEAHAEKQRLEQDLLHTQKLDSLGTMAAGIAHDFNNSLCAISSSTELAMWHLGEPNERVAKYLKGVMAATHQASELTQTLLTFAGKLRPKKETTQLQKILNDSLQLVRRVLPASVQIESTFVEDPLWCDLDPIQINQVLVNLAMNSRDSMPDGGALRFEAFRSSLDEGGQTSAVLRIIDTGYGMDEQTLSRIFEPFFTTKARGKGTGLGMSMVHSIIASHDGEIDVESQVGVGTIVEIRLPTSSASFHKQPTSSSVQVRKALKGVVIIADDEPRVRETLMDAFNSTGLIAVGVEDGKQLIDYAREHQAEMVLIAADIDMPHVDGVTAVKRIRESHGDIPAIIFTGQAAVPENLEDGQTAFLRKPFQLDELLDHATRLAGKASVV